jgi:hypothetical protein
MLVQAAVAMGFRLPLPVQALREGEGAAAALATLKQVAREPREVAVGAQAAKTQTAATAQLTPAAVAAERAAALARVP